MNIDLSKFKKLCANVGLTEARFVSGLNDMIKGNLETYAKAADSPVCVQVSPGETLIGQVYKLENGKRAFFADMDPAAIFLPVGLLESTPAKMVFNLIKMDPSAAVENSRQYINRMLADNNSYALFVWDSYNNCVSVGFFEQGTAKQLQKMNGREFGAFVYELFDKVGK